MVRFIIHISSNRFQNLTFVYCNSECIHLNKPVELVVKKSSSCTYYLLVVVHKKSSTYVHVTLHIYVHNQLNQVKMQRTLSVAIHFEKSSYSKTHVVTYYGKLFLVHTHKVYN